MGETMKKLCLVLIMTIISTLSAQAQSAHAKHNMILLGEKELFLSHIVYKVPHNYQILVKVKLDSGTQTIYSKARSQYPDNLFIFLLSEVDLVELPRTKILKGNLLVELENGTRTVLEQNVEIDDFSILYFDELPLDLSSHH